MPGQIKCENGGGPSVKHDPEHYVLPDLPEAPVFYPTAEEFADPMKYLDSIRPQAEPAGVIKIVPPKEWRCPFPIKENGDSFHFQTCVQSVDQLRHRHGPGTKFMQNLRHFHRTRGLNLPAEVSSLSLCTCAVPCSIGAQLRPRRGAMMLHCNAWVGVLAFLHLTPGLVVSRLLHL